MFVLFFFPCLLSCLSLDVISWFCYQANLPDLPLIDQYVNMSSRIFLNVPSLNQSTYYSKRFKQGRGIRTSIQQIFVAAPDFNCPDTPHCAPFLPSCCAEASQFQLWWQLQICFGYGPKKANGKRNATDLMYVNGYQCS